MPFEPPKSDSELLAPSPKTPGKKRIVVVTGTRAEYGLLKPVIRAIIDHPLLEAAVVVSGSHLLAGTHAEVAADFRVAGIVPMQRPGAATRIDDALAVGAGVSRFARSYYKINADAVLVLGDRIEAFAAAAAASIGGVPLAHIHGGDRAEGIADEAMRHAISKLAHLHFPATPSSAERLRRMGENPQRVFMVGSPAIDGLREFPELSDQAASELGDPQLVILLHPAGLEPGAERDHATAVVDFASATGRRVLMLAPNFDPGRENVLAVLKAAASSHGFRFQEHLPRPQFVGLLKRLARHDGLIVGNSSAGLIEAAAVHCRSVNVGPRQAGRETPPNVVTVPVPSAGAIAAALASHQMPLSPIHPYGEGDSGPRIAAVLGETDLASADLLRKRCAY